MAWQFEGPESQRPWGAPPAQPPPGHPRWTWRRSLVAVLVAAGIAAGGGAAVYAASGSAGPGGRDLAGPPGYGPMDGGPGGPGGGPAGGGPMSPNGANLLNALHGEFVVAGAGGYVTRLMQVGALVEASDESITVRSADGFTATYALDADTAKPDIATGDTVRVIATRSGDDLIADSVQAGARPAPPTR
ncbi:MAG TPA: hypothetical protein VFM37_12695 [Pseudonocardiaceae bacterium]|nr:hypothetical protein [Pseudonocardiaceae bacterium]